MKYKFSAIFVCMYLFGSSLQAAPTDDGSVHKRRVEPERLAKDAPNISVILEDDAGFGVSMAKSFFESDAPENNLSQPFQSKSHSSLDAISSNIGERRVPND